MGNNMDIKKNKDNKENKKISIKEIFLNRQYRSIAILIFYFVLFVVIIIGIRMPNNTYFDDGGNVVSELSGYELIENKNFGYKYTVTVDDEVYLYEGKKYNDKELVVITKNDESREYYFNKEDIYVKEKESYVKTIKKPYMLFDFFDTDILDKIIIRSVIVDEENHKYKVDNQKIFDVISDEFARIENGYNYISLIYRNEFITGITFDFSNYAKTMKEDFERIIISLEYFDFNLIDDFEVEVKE